jgi:hypothetical protein
MIDLHCSPPKGQQSHDFFWKRMEFRMASFSSTSAMMIADVVTEIEEENVDVIRFRQFGMLPEGADHDARQGA